ncbi:hypothetical protein AYK26_03280 [Euryarchaeota archaeon SM23-78]|nr:MAG: hypothetical protein AYK26_03280 [Euryarchaeota archaeon SM23-78]
MSELKELLEKRIQVKKKRPAFTRKDAHKKKKLRGPWRRPRGLHNKKRLKGRSHGSRPSTGYRAPSSVRGIHRSGLTPVLVSSIRQLASLTKEHGIILSSRLGNKKKQTLIAEIMKKHLVLLNLEPDKTLEQIEAKLKERQKIRKEKFEMRKEKKKGIEEKVKREEAKKAEKKEEELTDEEKKKLEKEEKDKLLTKRT